MRFFTSDIHFGHTNIIRYCSRPYESTEDMDQDIVLRWNQQVAQDDEVVILGDLALGKLGESLEMASLLNGRKILVPGNHDHCWIGHKKRGSGAKLYEAAGFEVLDQLEPRDMAGRRVEFCHFPFAEVALEGENTDKFAKWRPVEKGQWLIHGHVHDRWRQRGRMINVGIDAWGGRLVAEPEIEEIISGGPGELDRWWWPSEDSLN